jgi:hypothetical protein
MANGSIIFENSFGGVKKAPIGFSWTTFFFGGIPALMRGHIGLGLIQIIVQLFTFGLSSIVFAFIYNKIYTKYLIGEGFKVRSIEGNKSHSDVESWVGMSVNRLES